jgi:hypothetical protein
VLLGSLRDREAHQHWRTATQVPVSDRLPDGVDCADSKQKRKNIPRKVRCNECKQHSCSHQEKDQQDSKLEGTDAHQQQEKDTRAL